MSVEANYKAIVEDMQFWSVETFIAWKHEQAMLRKYEQQDDIIISFKVIVEKFSDINVEAVLDEESNNISFYKDGACIDRTSCNEDGSMIKELFDWIYEIWADQKGD